MHTWRANQRTSPGQMAPRLAALVTLSFLACSNNSSNPAGTGDGSGSGGAGNGGTSHAATGGQASGGADAAGGGTGTGGNSGGTTTRGGSSGSGGGTETDGSAGGGIVGGATGTGGVVTAAFGGRSGGIGGAAGMGGGAGGIGGGAGGSMQTAAAGGSNGLHYYVAANGSGGACTSDAPCSLTQAQTAVRASASSGMQGDILVELADGVYRLPAPLVFTEADSGTNGHTVTWQAATGAHPVLSGGEQITGWAVSEPGKNIWKAPAPGTFASRQLYVDGKIATRSRLKIDSRLSFTSSGLTFSDSSLSFLNSAAQQSRIELHVVGDWTDHYAPVQSIANNTATMVQPAWKNNSWGWDTITSPFGSSNPNGQPSYIENAYELLNAPGQWYQDTAAGVLYYIPLSGEDMTKVDVELPQTQAIVVVAGSSYDTKAQNLTFSGLTFSHTSWLNPSTSDGYACQQTNTFIHGDGTPEFPNGYPEFEATRSRWWQMPAAVQVSVATNVSFVGDTFVALGSVGLGIGNDDDAHMGNLGLGTDSINVTGCVFQQIAAGAIVIGGVQATAHHPCGDAVCGAADPGAKMINQDSTVSDNLIHDVGIDYRDSAGIFLTYTANVLVSHNELYNLPYSGINFGFGWGMNDAGGSQDYANRGDYNYQPKYTTPTTAKNNKVQANLLRDMMQQLSDGACLYSLSANPGTTVAANYCKGNNGQQDYYGYSADEGSRYITINQNAFDSYFCIIGENANSTNNTGNLTVTNNWYNEGELGVSNGNRNDTVSGNVTINGTTWPADAQAVIAAAGLEPAYLDLTVTP